MWFWKHNKSTKPVVIDTENLKKLPKHAQEHFAPVALKLHGGVVTHEVIHHDESGDNFGLSMLVGMETDSVGVGYLAGGSLSGALMGEMLAESHHGSSFGGGDAGGAGAGGSYAPDPAPVYDNGGSGADCSGSDSSSSFDSGSSSGFDSGGCDFSSSDSSSSFDSGSSFPSDSSSF